jgi:UDP-glucose 4-epimerase
VAFPVKALQGVARMLGRAEEIRRLTGSLTVDIAETRREFGWCPPVSVDEGIARTVAWYRSRQRGHDC